MDSPDELQRAVSALTSGQWRHLAAAVNRSAGTAKLYVNGAEVASGAVHSDFSNNVPLFIGSMGGGQYTQNLQAHCDETRIDPRILTPDEIAGLAGLRGQAPLISSLAALPSPPVAGQALTLGIEFVLGGKPKDESSFAKLPPISVDASTITFIFRRTAAAAFLNPRVETVVDPTNPTVLKRVSTG